MIFAQDSIRSLMTISPTLLTDTFDHVHVQSAIATQYTLYKVSAAGVRTVVTQNGLLAANSSKNYSPLTTYCEDVFAHMSVRHNS